MYEISTCTASHRSVVATVESLDAARAYADRLGAVVFEIDEDYPECADFLARGDVYAVQPVGFSLGGSN